MSDFFTGAAAQGATEDRPRYRSPSFALPRSGSRRKALRVIITDIVKESQTPSYDGVTIENVGTCVAPHGEPERSERGGAKRGNSPLRVSATIKIAVALATLCVVSGCGFEPLHGRQQRAARDSQIESVAIETDGSRFGQLLKAEIEDQVNPDAVRAEKPFTMAIKFTETEVSLFINSDGTSSRGDMQYNSNYVLRRKQDGKVIDTGAISRVSSYNISENADYATYVSREDARKRGVLELAQDYKLRLANLVAKLNNPNATPAPVTEELPAPLIRAQDNHENRPTGF